MGDVKLFLNVQGRCQVSNSKMQYGILLVIQKEILELPASGVAEIKIFLTAAVQP